MERAPEALCDHDRTGAAVSDSALDGPLRMPASSQVPPHAPWTAPAIALLGLPIYGVPGTGGGFGGS